MRFGEFELIPQHRRLERHGAAVGLSSRAMDILCLLVERPGEVVTKREILSRVWPDVLVDEGSVRFHVAALRRALGDGEDGARFITTVPGRGYCFVGMDRPSSNLGAPAPTQPAIRRLPPPPPWVVGRDEAIRELTQRLDDQRFVSVVGPGGIGKTTVALMAAHAWATSRDDPVLFVDLGTLSRDTPEAVAEALAAALGLSAQAGGELGRVVDHLRPVNCLVVLDTCERAIDGASRLAEAVFAEAPNVRLLATSREALRVEGEWVYRIQPLAAPKPDAGLSAGDALRYPAVQLFVHRAATRGGFVLRDEDAPLVSAICRDLDGMALAIELAAGRVEAYGVRQVASLLSTEFALTWPGRRTAAPRQQTLNATLNWSHELLSVAERGVFRRLAVLVGAFSFQEALSVATGGEISPAAASDAVSSLVAKSLLSAESHDDGSRYRMGDATRAFAWAKLAASSEEPAARLRHAQTYLRYFENGGPEDRAPVSCHEQVANVRVALEWAFGPGGDSKLGVKLAAAASPLWLRRGWPVYCQRLVREALGDLARRSYPADEMDEYVTLVSSLAYTDGLTPEMHRDWEAAYDNARREGRPEHKFTGLFVLWTHETRIARYQAAQDLLDKADFLDAGGADATQRAMTDWMVGLSAHFLGNHELARERLEHLVGEFTEAAGRPVLRQFGYDLESSAHRVLSLTHFLLGNFDQARAASDRAVVKAQALGHALPIANAQLWRVFLLYLLGDDFHEVDSLTRCLIESARNDSMDYGLAMAHALPLRGLWLARSGDVARGKEMALEGLDLCSQKNYFRLHPFVRAELASQVARRRDQSAGPERGVEFHEEADAETWCTPEILRIKGEIAERDGDPQAAETLYRQALTLAERQGALTWRLRAAIGLAGLWIAQDRAADAAAVLAPVFDQFKPGRQQSDLRLAAQHLEVCRRARTAA